MCHFSNLTGKDVFVHWVNYIGKVRKDAAKIPPTDVVSVYTELCHPHVIKDASGNNILGYEAKSRGPLNGNHVIFIGKVNVSDDQIARVAQDIVDRAQPDTRQIPTTGPPPPAPRPEDRKGKFYGGR